MEKELAKKMYDCIVVGGGAAGMMAAITAARNNARVLIIDQSKKLGNKILQTGNGKCNFTNMILDSSKYNNDNIDFVKTALGHFDQNDAVCFFKSIGIFPKEKNGYVYPHSETAASVQEAMISELCFLGVDIVLETTVENIEKKDNIFVVNNKYISSNVIISAGSKAAPKTGSDGSGYMLAKLMGHDVKKPLPALVQLISDNKFCKMAAGVRSTGSIELHCKDKVYSEYGEIQYTDYGLSGIPIFQISRFAVKSVDNKEKTYIDIDMVPDYSKHELTEYAKNCCGNTEKNIVQLFSGILNKKLVLLACNMRNIDPELPVTFDNLKKIQMVISAIKRTTFNITGYKSFDNAQVCQGGVNLNEINPDTMQSIIVPGLFYAGEILDVDGICGGYNLQWAWTSGYLAGNNIKNHLP